MFAMTCVTIAFIVLTPAPPAEEAQEWLGRWLDRMHNTGRLPDVVTFDRIEWLANVVMFTPFGAFLAAAVRPALRLTAVPMAAATSLAIEFAQRFIPNRVPSAYDVLANTLGGLLGLLILIAVTTVIRPTAPGDTFGAMVAAAYRRAMAGRRLSRGVRVAAGILLAITLIVVGAIVWTPGPPAAASQEALAGWISAHHETGALPSAVTFARIEWLANIVMFIPLGLFTAAVLPPLRRIWVLPATLALSSVIELAQNEWLPSRVASLYDVIANTLGATIGFVMLVWVTRFTRGRVGR